MNVVIQVLKSRIPDDKIGSLTCQHDFNAGCIDCAFASLIHEMMTQATTNPRSFVSFLTGDQFSDQHQDDAYNFLIHMLFNLRYNYSEDFAIKHVTITSCINFCGPNRIEENYIALTLDIKGHSSLEDALTQYFSTEELDSLCACGGRQLKSFEISDAPNSIMIRLKRFSFLNGNYIKLNHDVHIPEQLHLNFGGEEVCYNFSSAIMHSGASYTSGHYTAFVKRQSQLFFCNDSIIKEADFEDFVHAQSYVVVFDKWSDAMLFPRSTSQVSVSPPASPFNGFDTDDLDTNPFEVVCKHLTISFL